MCHPKQHILAKLVHKMRVFKDEDTELLFDLQLDRFASSQVMRKVVVMFLAVIMMSLIWLKWSLLVS